MPDETGDTRQSERNRQKEYMRGGKGRKDEVGRSGIYPGSLRDVPADAEVRTPGDLVSHKGPRQKPANEPDSPGTDDDFPSE
jgi:hypothetical protein